MSEVEGEIRFIFFLGDCRQTDGFRFVSLLVGHFIVHFDKNVHLIETRFEFLQPFAIEEQDLVEFAKEVDGQVKIKTNENQMQLEYALIEPDKEQVEQTEDELAEVLRVR